MISADGSWEDYKYKVENTPKGRRLRLVSGKNGEVWEAQ